MASDTPRTDEIQMAWAAEGLTWEVMFEFCRALERDLSRVVGQFNAAVNALADAQSDATRATANHAADLSAAPEEAPLVELGELVLIPDGMGTIVAEWNDERHTMPPGTKLYGRAPMNIGGDSK